MNTKKSVWKRWYMIILYVFLGLIVFDAFLPEESNNINKNTGLRLIDTNDNEVYIPTETNTQEEEEIIKDRKEEINTQEEIEEKEDEEDMPSNYYKVSYIVDGDTLEISAGERVRLICIDTPKKGEYYYQEAKDYLKSLVLNKEVELVKDVSETDIYGRLLRYVYLDDDFINEIMVLNGYAMAYPYSPDTKLCPQIQQVEQQAKSEEIGIWVKNIEEIEETKINEDIICNSNFYNCSDFSTQSESQSVFDYCKFLGKGDIHKLDRDDEGIPCETLG